MDAGPCVGEAPDCVLFYEEHVCSDVVRAAECVDDRWVCPAGHTPGGISECWCTRRAAPWCECTPRGWECTPDAGVADAGGCPSDPSAVGTPCAEEGRFCGGCTDPCGFCNILRCEGGVWTRLEAPPPPGPCVSFACGPSLRCDAVTQHCTRSVSDVAGEPDGYACTSYPDGCASCECLSGDACEGTSDTGITVTWFGG
ncbi:MAG: hypothetical protein M5U28_22345 [Sandaracinaceae bacterium]|nr:hypothetical protein [Sandaracinaceae bacterium]